MIQRWADGKMDHRKKIDYTDAKRDEISKKS